MRPFRAEHIGSLLRPAALLAARREFDGGSLSAQALRDAEDRFIRDAVALQERVGLEVITDGEYRRVIYFGHFPAAVSGFTEIDAEITFQDARGGAMTYRTPVVTGKLARRHGIATDEFEFVRGLTTRTPKVTLPSPCSQHAFRWREGVSERAYPDVEEFFAHVAGIYREELLHVGICALGDALTPPKRVLRAGARQSDLRRARRQAAHELEPVGGDAVPRRELPRQ